MENYLRIREKGEHRSAVTGIVMTVAVHVLALVLVSFSGLKYIYPPPQEQSFLVDFEEEPVPELIEGREPAGGEVNPEEHVEIVQRSESPVQSEAPNLTPETKPDDFGDVSTPAPVQEEPKLDPRAAFPGMSKKDTSLTAPHGAEEAASGFKAGQAKGNTTSGAADGKPNARLEGRTVDKAGLKKPVYSSQESGTVVVNIWVDNYGTVVRAVPGGDGTTVTDKTLWAAARTAAMETHFNMDAKAPAMQEGTITYIFNLK